MSKDKVTIKDVAEEAGVSPTTVSRVINDSDHPVSERTATKVRKAVQELDFQPNRIAQNLKKDKSHIIGVIVHDISDAYFAQIVKGIEEATSKYNYIVNIYNTYRDVEKELRAVNMLKINRADAVIFTGGSLLDEEYETKMEQYVKELKARGSIVTGVTAHPFQTKDVSIDNNYASQKITDYIIDKGHRKIAYISGPEILSTSKQRYKGYKEALRNKNITGNNKYIIQGDFTFEGGRRAALELLDYINEITAVVASNDETALGVMWELKNQGINVPEEISVVGIGDIPDAKYSYPPLTTISLPTYKIGVKLGANIVNILQKEKDKIEKEKIDWEIELVERGSVKEIR